jgi:adenylate cyclase
MLKRYTDALPLLRECVSRSPNYRAGRTWLAATYAQLGQLEEARGQAAEVLRLDPKFTICKLRKLAGFKHARDAEHYFDALRKSGMPES